MEDMSARANDYGSLLAEKRPEVIHGEKQNEAYINALEELLSRPSRTPAEEKLAELLALLIEDFESKHYQLGDAGPVEVIRHLMEENGLRQKDLVDVFGTESIVSEVLNGKRSLTTEHIKRLSARFAVSPAVFF
jgi:HTH-type transcriptional regulator/antitoxin HigA